jgi:hypothetical protein
MRTMLFAVGAHLHSNAGRVELHHEAADFGFEFGGHLSASSPEVGGIGVHVRGPSEFILINTINARNAGKQRVDRGRAQNGRTNRQLSCNVGRNAFPYSFSPARPSHDLLPWGSRQFWPVVIVSRSSKCRGCLEAGIQKLTIIV